jgi:tRNA A37 threonylcarbamoyladenosine modification protein TsaB
MAQGWQLARSVNLQGVSSVECMAAQAHDEGIRGRVSIVVDAQRGEFYFAPYQLDTEWRELSPLRLVLGRKSKRSRQKVTCLSARNPKLVPASRAVFPRAATLGKLAMNRANYLGGEQIEPIYLRPSAFLKAPPPRILRMAALFDECAANQERSNFNFDLLI